VHEIRLTLQESHIEDVARLALAAGVGRVSVYDVFVYGPNQSRKIASVETSTPRAKIFIDALFAAEWFNPAECSITTRELRAILAEQPLREVTRPMVEPALDVLEDLWQLSHVTPSYVGRAAGAAVLIAYGMFENRCGGMMCIASVARLIRSVENCGNILSALVSFRPTFRLLQIVKCLRHFLCGLHIKGSLAVVLAGKCTPRFCETFKL
jgi:hypothetical protein